MNKSHGLYQAPYAMEVKRSLMFLPRQVGFTDDRNDNKFNDEKSLDEMQKRGCNF